MLGEQAPMLRVWGSVLSPRIARLIRTHPPLLRRLALAPRRALHSYAVAVYQAVERGESDRDLAVRLDVSNPRDLLLQAFPDCDRRLYRVLDRAGDRVHEATFYERLDQLLRSPLASSVLAADVLSPGVLTCYEAVQRMDPLVLRARRALQGRIERAEAFNDLTRMLRGFGVLDGVGADDLPEDAGRRTVGRFLQRHMNLIRAPDPGFTPPPGLCLVRSVGELRAAGLRLNNCLRRLDDTLHTYWVDLATGHRVFLVGENPLVAVCLRRCGPTVWCLEQIAGRNNTELGIEARQRIEREIAKVRGIVVIRQHPRYALADLFDDASAAEDAEPDAADDIQVWAQPPTGRHGP